MNLRTPLLQTLPQQDESAFEVVFEFGKIKRFVEPKPPIRELRGSARAMLVQELPEDLCRQASHKVLTVYKDALIALEVLHLYPGALAVVWVVGRRRGRLQAI